MNSAHRCFCIFFSLKQSVKLHQQSATVSTTAALSPHRPSCSAPHGPPRYRGPGCRVLHLLRVTALWLPPIKPTA